MKNTLQKHIEKEFPFLQQHKLLIAVSGGIDSMVLLHLFKELGCNLAIAHCNFQLRGIESFEDQLFVQDYGSAQDIPVFVTQFDTGAFANDYKLSIQVAARELRYNWFSELLEENNYDYLLTGHHADDNLETFLIHLIRGTGLDGFTGIPAQNGNVIRPLLQFSRAEIEHYAVENSIKWREDSSNEADKYLRNTIRHHLVPILKGLNSDFLSSFHKTQSHLQESKAMVEDASFMVYQHVAKEIGTDIHFDIKRLKKQENYKSYLYHWLSDFGFSAWADIYHLIDGQSGKQIFSAEFRLLKNRDFLIVSPINTNVVIEEYYIFKNQKEVKIPLKLSLCNINDISTESNQTIFVDEDKLLYPLVLRRWRDGDSFQPLGMAGKSKKVSKFFKDEKLSLIEKENTWLLCSNNDIVWIVGIRQDERFKAKTTSNNILKLNLK